MKKRLFLVNYLFTTGDRDYSEYELVTVKFNGHIDDTHARRLAEDKTTRWFESTYRESELRGVIAKSALEVTDSEVTTKEDGYSADMALDRIDQLIEETKPYTDRLVLKGWAPMETIEYFQGRPGHARYYVNTFEDPDNHDQYTVIKWG